MPTALQPGRQRLRLRKKKKKTEVTRPLRERQGGPHQGTSAATPAPMLAIPRVWDRSSLPRRLPPFPPAEVLFSCRQPAQAFNGRAGLEPAVRVPPPGRGLCSTQKPRGAAAREGVNSGAHGLCPQALAASPHCSPGRPGPASSHFRACRSLLPPDPHQQVPFPHALSSPSPASSASTQRPLK